MRRSWPLMIVMVLGMVLGMVVSVACGGDDSASPSASKTTTASSTGGGSGSGNASGDTKATAGATSSGVAAGLADLQKAAREAKVIDYRVTYDTSTTDAKGTTTSGAMTLEHKGTKSLIAMDSAFSGSAGQGKVTIIDDGTSTFLCTEQTKACLKLSSTSGTAANPFLGIADGFKTETLLGNYSKDGYEVKTASGQTIAGRQAKCYDAKSPTGTATICLDSKNGMLLLYDGTNTTGGQTTKQLLKAKEASDAPSDADFNPPYTVQSLPGQ